MLRCDRRTIYDALAIVALGLALGLAVNYRMVLVAVTGNDAQLTTPITTPGAPPTSAYPTPVQLAEVKALLASGAVALDARAIEIYRQGHLPAALSLPLGDAEGVARLQKRLPSNQVLVTYCSGYGCTDSFDLAMALIAAGFTQVRVFEGGYPEWHDAGLAIERGTP